MQARTIDIVPHGRDVYGRTLADVFVNGQNVAEVMTGEGFGRKGVKKGFGSHCLPGDTQNPAV